MNAATQFRKNPDVVARNLSDGEGSVLLHLQTGAYHGMNPVALVIWDQIDGDHTVADLIAAVRDRVDDPPEELDRDVRAFLQSALDRDLIETVDSAPGNS